MGLVEIIWNICDVADIERNNEQNMFHGFLVFDILVVISFLIIYLCLQKMDITSTTYIKSQIIHFETMCFKL
jgi:hypothetical protein